MLDNLPFTLLFALLIAAMIGVVIYTTANVRYWSLDTLPPLPGEEVLFQDADARFSELPARHGALGSSFWFLKAVVRVTNRRVIIAQPLLFAPRRDRVMRVIYYSDDEFQDAPGARTALYTYRTRLRDARVVRKDQGELLKLSSADDPALMPLAPVYTLIKSPILERYVDRLRISPEVHPFDRAPS